MGFNEWIYGVLFIHQLRKISLLLLFLKNHTLAYGPITSWQIDRETVETVTDFILLGSNITADGDCSRDIERPLLPGRKAVTSVDSLLKIRYITLLTKVCMVKAMIFPIFMYGC